jgi:integrase
MEAPEHEVLMSLLTAKTVEKAVPKKREYKLSDGSGLYLRVRISGAKSWLFSFRLPNSRKVARMTLGSFEDLSLKEARAKLPDLRKLVAEGADPRHARAAAKAENAQAITMQVLLDIWLENMQLGNKMSLNCVKRHRNRWNNYLKKALSALLVKDVGRSHLATTLDTMTRKGIKEETRKALTTLNLMLDYALARHLIDQNPARMLKPKDFSATANRPRDRVLSLIELRQLWLALEQSHLNIAFTTIIALKLLILTGARRGEIAGMRWVELDLDKKVWLLPSSRTKNRQAHIIYLSDLAVSLIKSLLTLTGHSLFVFDTGRNTKTGHILPDSLNRALDRLCKNNKSGLVELQGFTIHDLRRTAATAWGEDLKTDPHVIERMLNHLPLNKLMATYQRAIYAKEQKKTWLAWGRMVAQQVTKNTGNVVPYSGQGIFNYEHA